MKYLFDSNGGQIVVPISWALVLVIVFAGSWGCEDETGPPKLDSASESKEEEPPQEESAVDESMDVECPGATDEELEAPVHPRVLRGQIQWPETEDSDIDRTLRLVEIDDRGEPSGDSLEQVEIGTDRRWCLRVPDELEFGPRWALVFGQEQHRLRRLLVHPEGVDIHPRSEALVQVLVEEGHRLLSIDPQSYINLEIEAQMAVEQRTVVRPRTQQAGVGSFVARLIETMDEDRLLGEELEKAYERAEPRP